MLGDGKWFFRAQEHVQSITLAFAVSLFLLE